MSVTADSGVRGCAPSSLATVVARWQSWRGGCSGAHRPDLKVRFPPQHGSLPHQSGSPSPAGSDDVLEGGGVKSGSGEISGRLYHHGSGDAPGHRGSSRGTTEVPFHPILAMFPGGNLKFVGLGDGGGTGAASSLGVSLGERWLLDEGG
jgi:hypothetical protein